MCDGLAAGGLVCFSHDTHVERERVRFKGKYGIADIAYLLSRLDASAQARAVWCAMRIDRVVELSTNFDKAWWCLLLDAITVI